MELKKLIERTKEISKRFPRQWKKGTRFVDLVEEVGELANAILVEEGEKPKQVLHKGNSVADALCDLLFDVFLLAEEYGLDLPEEYIKMLERLEERLAEGEFEEEKDGV